MFGTALPCCLCLYGISLRELEVFLGLLFSCSSFLCQLRLGSFLLGLLLLESSLLFGLRLLERVLNSLLLGDYLLSELGLFSCKEAASSGDLALIVFLEQGAVACLIKRRRGASKVTRRRGELHDAPITERDQVVVDLLHAAGDVFAVIRRREDGLQPRGRIHHGKGTTPNSAVVIKVELLDLAFVGIHRLATDHAEIFDQRCKVPTTEILARRISVDHDAVLIHRSSVVIDRLVVRVNRGVVLSQRGFVLRQIALGLSHQAPPSVVGWPVSPVTPISGFNRASESRARIPARRRVLMRAASFSPASRRCSSIWA